jgi:hypothetical protein
MTDVTPTYHIFVDLDGDISALTTTVDADRLQKIRENLP